MELNRDEIAIEDELETRDIICEGGREVLGTVSFPKGTDEETWEKALSGYACDEHPPQPAPPTEIEAKLAELDSRLRVVETRVVPTTRAAPR